MSGNRIPRGKRGPLGREPVDRRVTIQLTATEHERYRALADRYGVSLGALLREAAESGMRAVTERLRRAARAVARGRGNGAGK